MDLMDMVKGAVTKQIMGKLGGFLGGADEKKTSSAFEMAAGSIIGGLIKKAGSAEGAGQVFDMATKQDDGILDKLGDLLGGGQASDDFQKSGGGLLDGIFGSQQTGILSTLAKFLNIDEGMIGGLMKMVAPIVMGMIGRHLKSKALDAVGLGSFLGEQKKSLGFMPSSLTDGLGFGNLLSNVTSAGKDAVSGAATNAQRAVTGAANDAASAGSGLFKFLIPLLIISGLAFAGWKIFGKAGDVIDGAKDAAQTALDDVKDKVGGFKIPGLDLGSIEGFDMKSLGTTGPALAKGFGDITSGFEGLKESGTEGANALVTKITSFGDSIGGLGLDKLTGPAKSSASGLIAKFIEVIKGLLNGQNEGIQGILKPAIDGLMNKLKMG